MGTLYVGVTLPSYRATHMQIAASIVLMFVFGVALLAAFAIWDLKYASLPVITPAFVRNRSVVCASLIGCFDFVSLFSFQDRYN